MADKSIGSLPAAESVADDALLAAEIQGVAVKITGEQLKALVKIGVEAYVQSAQTAAADAQAAAEDAKEAAGGIGTAVEDSKANAEAAQEAEKGAAAARTAIESMLVEAITLTTGSPATVSKSLVDGVVKLVFGLPPGPQGEQGNPGSSIQSITRTAGTGAPGTTDTYTITLTDRSTTSFTVYNGKDGTGAGDMSASIYDPQGKARDIFLYVDEAVAGAGTELPVASAETLGGIKIGDNMTVAADGTASVPAASTGRKGVTYLVDAVDRSDTDKAATPRAVKQAYDLAVENNPYKKAVEAGYTGTEAELYAALVSLQNGPFLPLAGGTVTGPVILESSDLQIKDETGTVKLTLSQWGGIAIPNGDGGIYLCDGSPTDTQPVLEFYGLFGDEFVTLRNIETPTSDADAANKGYVDAQIGEIGTILDSINGEAV